jgi:hypothetical protein
MRTEIFLELSRFLASAPAVSWLGKHNIGSDELVKELYEKNVLLVGIDAQVH